jgi:hypothetical protein
MAAGRGHGSSLRSPARSSARPRSVAAVTAFRLRSGARDPPVSAPARRCGDLCSSGRSRSATPGACRAEDGAGHDDALSYADGDGLLNAVETSGIDVDRDGIRDLKLNGVSGRTRPVPGLLLLAALRAGVMTCRRITTPVTALYVADWALPSSDRHRPCQPTGQP